MEAEKFKDHPFFLKIADIRNKISGIQNLPIQYNEHKEYILNSLDYIEVRLKKFTDISFIDEQWINNLNNNTLQNILNQINQFLSDNNFQHLINIKNQLYNLIKTINIDFPIPLKSEDYFQGIVNNFKEKIESDIQSFIQDLSQKIKGNENQIQQLNANLNALQQNYNTTNNNVQQLITKFNADFTQFQDQAKQKLEEQINNIQKDSKQILDELNKKLEEAKKIVNVIGNVAISHSYKETAEYHKKQANKFRCISLGFMVVSVVYLIVIIILTTMHHNADWWQSLIRIVAATLFIYPAQYAAAQSNKHRELENYNRKMELDLAAINPFIELLDENKKKEIKEKLVERYFKPIEIEKVSDNAIPTTLLEKILQMLKSFKN
ncbi:MAG: hypothetical protein KatS3mg027_2445 [Bacteroidia bacterium]|nr:MAG: hypothetical protein KatS3mg027_2445 [Bacteroidia bacterium]